jgi:hypothetical protein
MGSTWIFGEVGAVGVSIGSFAPGGCSSDSSFSSLKKYHEGRDIEYRAIWLLSEEVGSPSTRLAKTHPGSSTSIAVR